MAEEREELKRKAAEFAKYGRKFDKALDAVLAGGVKECRFTPSGRKIFTVVGKMGDEFIDPEKPYCSCSNFFFKVTRGREELCYHLLSYRIAVETGRIDVVEFDDEEYAAYISAAIGDVFQVLARSSE
jgi:predicted nucleic acid-binding Zn finger protein